MRATVIWLFFAFTTAQYVEQQVNDHEAYIEEDPDIERVEREVHYDPYEEHIRVKRCEYEPQRVKRSDYVRRPRQVHQYEVYEFNEDSVPSSPPYEEMLAASAEHYHKVYVAPGPPVSARYLAPDVGTPVYRQPVPADPGYVQVLPPPAPINVSPLNVSPDNVPVQHSRHSVPVPVPVLTPVEFEEDQAPASAAHHQQQHKQSHVQGGGKKNQEHYHKQQGAKSSKGFHNDEHTSKGGKGHKIKDLHKKEYEESLGQKKKHHDNAEHKGSHEEAAHGQKGSKFDEKKGHKKGHKTKGYHNKYHKDEFHKEHKFYDDYHKSGDHHRYGKFHAKHASNESGKKKAHRVDAGHDSVEHGKKGFSNKGHLDSDHKGHKSKQGHEEHHHHQEHHGKKGGKAGGSHWGYQKKQ